MIILGTVSSRVNSIAQFITVFLVFLLVLALTYFTTRWVGSYQKLQTNHPNFEVIETCKITANKYLLIVKAGKKYLVIAIGKDTVTMLTELSEEEVVLTKSGKIEPDSFQKIFSKAKDAIHKRGDH